MFRERNWIPLLKLIRSQGDGFYPSGDLPDFFFKKLAWHCKYYLTPRKGSSVYFFLIKNGYSLRRKDYKIFLKCPFILRDFYPKIRERSVKDRINQANASNLLSHGLGISILDPINSYDFEIEGIRHLYFKKSRFEIYFCKS